jgi:hypothetical protein
MNRKRELAKALADLWNEEIPPGTRVFLHQGEASIEAETFASAWARFEVPVIQICCFHDADLRIARLQDLEPAPIIAD